MTRYKGRVSARAIERDFPHVVETVVPEGGFRKRLDAMYEWHRSRGIEAWDGRGRHEDDRDFVRWCFADPDLAAAFANEFDAI